MPVKVIPVMATDVGVIREGEPLHASSLDDSR
jgi:hypothetical protein